MTTSKPPTLRKSKRPRSIFRLTLWRSLRASWVTRSLRRAAKLEQREQRRLILLQAETDSSLLRLKELEQRRQSLLHRQEEMQQSLLWHETQVTSLRTGAQP